MTIAQVQADSRCLYIWGSQVYQKGDRSNPHYGHPCGTDVTSIIPASHVGNQAKYLLPNYVANICPAATSTPVPTSTPTPKPTFTPTPQPTATLAPEATPTSSPHATLTPVPQSTSIPQVTVTVQPQTTPVPTQSSVQFTPSPTPTSQTNVLSPTPTASGAVSTVTPTQGDPIMAMFTACFGINISSPACTNPQEVDFNHDGVIDGTDYNLYLLYKLNPSLTLALTPTSSASITAILTPVITVAPKTTAYSSPTNQPTALSSLTPTQTIAVTQPPLVSPSMMPYPTVVPESLIASLTDKIWLSKVLDWVTTIFLVAIMVFGIFHSKLFQKAKAGKPAQAVPMPAQTQSVQQVIAKTPDEPYDKTVFVSMDNPDSVNSGLWVKLTGDDGIISGYYKGTSIAQGFMRVKGVKKTLNGHVFIDIAEVQPII